MEITQNKKKTHAWLASGRKPLKSRRTVENHETLNNEICYNLQSKEKGNQTRS